MKEARSLKSPAFKETVEAAAAALSGSYLALNDAFIIFCFRSWVKCGLCLVDFVACLAGREGY